MPRVLKKSVPSQTLRASARPQLTIPLDDGTTMLALIQALIPLGLIAVGADEMIAPGRASRR